MQSVVYFGTPCAKVYMENNSKKMKRTLITALALSLQLASGMAQDNRWTLDSCMRYAVENATEVKRETVNARQRRDDYRSAVQDFLPSVSGAVQGQYAWGRNIDPETNTYNNVTTFNNYYQLYASLNVFDGFATVNAFRQAKLARNYSATAMQKVRDDVAIDVMQKYVDAAYAKASIKIAEEKLAESRRMLARIEKLYDLGEKSRPDVVQIEAQVAEDEYNLTHQQNEARQTLLALKSAMNYPVEESLTLEVSATTGVFSPLPSADEAESIYSSFSSISPDVKTAEYKLQSARYDYRIAKGNLMPSLTLSGGITTNYYENLSLRGQYDGFSTQFRNNRGEYLLLTLSIPIYNNSLWSKVRTTRNKRRLAEIDLDETRRKLHDKIAQAVMDAEGYAKELQQMQKKVESDSMAYHMQSRKFEEGMLSTFDLHTSAQTLLESRIKQLQMQMLLIIKQRLVSYYQGENLIK